MIALLAMSPSGEMFFTRDSFGIVREHRRLGRRDPLEVSEAVVDRVVDAVPVDQHRVVGQADDDAFGERAPGRIGDRRPGRFVDDPEDRLQGLPGGVGGRPSGDRLGHRIHVGDSTFDAARMFGRMQQKTRARILAALDVVEREEGIAP